jgi:hypothetical protein
VLTWRSFQLVLSKHKQQCYWYGLRARFCILDIYIIIGWKLSRLTQNNDPPVDGPHPFLRPYVTKVSMAL